MVELDSAQREARAREVRHEVVAQLTVGTHRIFRILFTVQWAVALVLAWTIGGAGRIAPLVHHADPRRHVVRAGRCCSCAPRRSPPGLRHFVAVCQIGWSMLFVWLLEGRLEAQFHVFVSLVFLAFYRDWTVLVDRPGRRHRLAGWRSSLMLPESYAIGASAAWSRLIDQAPVSRRRKPPMLLITVHQSYKTVWRFALQRAGLQLSQRTHRPRRAASAPPS